MQDQKGVLLFKQPQQMWRDIGTLGELFDTGSHKSFISAEVVVKLGLHLERGFRNFAFWEYGCRCKNERCD